MTIEEAIVCYKEYASMSKKHALDQSRGGGTMNELYIKLCPYCERYGRCPWSETCAESVPVELRKEIARLCLQDVKREEQQGIYDGEIPF